MPLDNEEETFEVVNSRNEVIGTAHRGECHQKGIPHRAVYCLVFNKDGKLLQQQRSNKCAQLPLILKHALKLVSHIHDYRTILLTTLTILMSS